MIAISILLLILSWFFMRFFGTGMHKVHNRWDYLGGLMFFAGFFLLIGRLLHLAFVYLP